MTDAEKLRRYIRACAILRAAVNGTMDSGDAALIADYIIAGADQLPVHLISPASDKRMRRILYDIERDILA